MIYISPTGSFKHPNPLLVNDADFLIKIQIDNSLDLGWKRKDILLVTNFAYEYQGIKSFVLKDVEFFDKIPQASKINAILKLFELDRIDNELYWFHDLDAFQLEPIKETELELEEIDMALTDYGRIPKWSTGSIFFKIGSKVIFEKIKEVVYKYYIDEERALDWLTANNKSLQTKIKKINKSYNFTAFNIRSCYKMAIKPIRVAHFHPQAGISQLGIERSFDFFTGKNKINTPLISTRLIKIFNKHGVR